MLKRIVAVRPIPAGKLLTAEDLTVKRNDRGLSARYWDLVIGTPAHRDYAADEAIEL
ncbi:MAG: SAF domain-containing protein [Dysosmobacter sp.]